MHSKFTRAILDFAEGLGAPPLRAADAWADEKRVLPESAPEPGPWRTDKVPYMREIMNAFEQLNVRVVAAVMASQMGKTEIIFNVIGKRFDEGPRQPVLYIGPTQKQVSSVSRDRIATMLRSVPSLWAKVERGQRDSIFEKFIAGIRFGFAWAGSKTEMSSHPAGVVMIDEYDRMEIDVGGEGDPLILGQARTKNYFNSKVGVFSTPTVEGASAAWKLLDKGTLEFWSWRCLHCGEWFVPRLELLKWTKAKTPRDSGKTARVACDKCGGEHKTRDRRKLNAEGKYIRHMKLKESKTGNVLDYYIPDPKPATNPIRSFWISGLCGPWTPFSEMVEVWLEACADNQQEQVQAVVNTFLGELYRVKGDAPEWEEVSKLRDEYRPRTKPDGVQLITAGVDVQKDGLYYVIRGWGYNLESWLLDQDYIVGATEFDPVWELLTKALYQELGESRVQRAFIDSGYRPGEPAHNADHMVYKYARSHHGIAFATKGRATMDTPLRSNYIDVTHNGMLIKNGVQLWLLNTDHLKTMFYSRLRWPQGRPGEMHLHKDITPEYCKQVVAEQLRITASGKRQWILKGANHYLDCETNALAAALSLQVEKLQPMPIVRQQQLAAEVAAQTTPPPNPFARATGDGFARR